MVRYRRWRDPYLAAMKPNDATTLLLVDDDEVNRMIVKEFLSDQPYCVEEAADVDAAWARLTQVPERFDAVLLDRVMPGVDGIELLRRVKGSADLAAIPVILQTSSAAPEQIIEGLREGAFYYLAKPFSAEMLAAIVRTAVRDRMAQRAVIHELSLARGLFGLIESATFRFRNLDEARGLASLAGEFLSEPAQTAMGLAELLVNAIEHGNLGLGYQDKSRLLGLGLWVEEIEKRLHEPAYRDRYATLRLQRHADHVEFEVTDMGQGFDWHEYLALKPSRAMDLHGRGIAIARSLCFDSIEYRGCGNIVVASKRFSLGDRGLRWTLDSRHAEGGQV